MIRHSLRRSLLSLSHRLTTSTTTTTVSAFPTASPLSFYRHFASFQIVVPSLGDSITEGTIAELSKSKGDDVSTDEVIARLETDKVSIDVRSTGSGKISAVNVKQGDTVHVGDVLFEGDDAGGGGGQKQQPAAATKENASTEKAPSAETQTKQPQQQQQQQPEPAAAPTKTQAIDSAHTQSTSQQPQHAQQGAHNEDDTQQHRAHHPLIQFRYGRRSNQSNPPSQPRDTRKQPTQVPASSLNKPSTSQQQQQQQQQQSVIQRGLQPDAYFNQDDFVRANEAAASARKQLPAYYRRKVWSEAEQEAVMMGGAPAYVPKALQKEKEKTAAAAGGKKK